jgi:hypothetical protein
VNTVIVITVIVKKEGITAIVFTITVISLTITIVLVPSVATWSSIWTIVKLAVLKGWQTRQLDFVLAYTQADVETDLYMEIPQGFQMKGKDQECVLKLKKDLYGQ